jgi:hypothetical protein
VIKGKSGFALMLVVSTIALLTGLLIGFFTLSNLQKTKINNLVLIENEKSQSRIQALIALNEAVAQLNSLLAQDNVITARADIIKDAQAHKAFWIGVWRVDKCNDDDVSATDSKKFLGWLVSKNDRKYFSDLSDSSLSDDLDFATTPIDNSYIGMVDDSYVINDHDQVYVQKIDIKDSLNEIIGHRAYWIDDESLKAQCNLYDDKYVDFPDGYFLQKSCPQRHGLEMLSQDNFPLTQSYLKNNTKALNVLHYSDFLLGNYFSNSEKSLLKHHFHDLTCCSRGLLTDSRNGGFRKNLTWYFESSSGPSAMANGSFVFPAPTTLPAPPTTWGYVRSFYKLKDNHIGDGIKPQPTYPLYHPQTWISYEDCSLHGLTMAGAKADDLGIPLQHGLFPIWTDFKMTVFGCYSNKYSPNNNSANYGWYYDSLRLQPAFGLKNPYPKKINGHDYSIIYAAPHILDNQSHQQVPTFSIKTYYQSNNMMLGNGTLTDLPLRASYSNCMSNPAAGSVGVPVIKNNYLWPLLDCKHLALDFLNNSKQYLGLSTFQSYIQEPMGKLLIKKTDNILSSPEKLENYAVNDLRKYQSENHKNQAAENSVISLDATSWQNLSLGLLENSTGLVMQEVDNITLTKTGNLSVARKPVYEKSQLLWLMNCYANDGRDEYRDNKDNLRWLANANPRAPIIGKSAWQDKRSLMPQNLTSNWSWSAEFLDKSNLSGETIVIDSNLKFPILFDLPHPKYGFLNLGFLQHMNAGLFGYHPAYCFGNSYQNPLIAREKFFQANAQQPTDWPSHYRVEMLYDYSYCLNRALWDSYFLTGLYRHDVLNKRLRPYGDATLDDLNSIDAAKKMYIHGAFNINSTSIDAWAAVLGSTIGLNDANKASYYRCLSPSVGIGEVKLEKNQIHTLANRIVEQIKIRGPFGSIGEFVNRKLIAKANDDTPSVAKDKQLGISGVLQRAIDGNYSFASEDIGADYESLNRGFSKIVKSSKNVTWYDDKAASGQVDACAPGYLTQADLLQSLGSTLAARGDTFCIHCYGDGAGKGGNPLARAEAIVQRLPDQGDPNGRAFKIISFKWID